MTTSAVEAASAGVAATLIPKRQLVTRGLEPPSHRPAHLSGAENCHTHHSDSATFNRRGAKGYS
jgi:hypothetical protein